LHTKTFEEVQNDPVEWGRIIESAIGAYLINQTMRNGCLVYYWRDRNDEVDFILEYHGKAIAIEVKSGYSKNKSGIEAFHRKFRPFKTYCIDNKGIPWHEFIKINPVELF